MWQSPLRQWHSDNQPAERIQSEGSISPSKSQMVFEPFLEKLGILHFRHSKKMHPHRIYFSPWPFTFQFLQWDFKLPTDWVSAQPQLQSDSLDWLYNKTFGGINTLQGKTTVSPCWPQGDEFWGQKKGTQVHQIWFFTYKDCHAEFRFLLNFLAIWNCSLSLLELQIIVIQSKVCG